jgi:hypothetical protein
LPFIAFYIVYFLWCRSAALESSDWWERERLAHLERLAGGLPRFSALRIFTVDRSTLLAVFSTILTYLIILLQTK